MAYSSPLTPTSPEPTPAPRLDVTIALADKNMVLTVQTDALSVALADNRLSVGRHVLDIVDTGRGHALRPRSSFALNSHTGCLDSVPAFDGDETVSLRVYDAPASSTVMMAAFSIGDDTAISVSTHACSISISPDRQWVTVGDHVISFAPMAREPRPPEPL